MYGKNFVICDKEKQYAGNLLQMLIGKKEPGIQFFLFHATEDVMQFARQKTVHILLIGEEFPQSQRMKIPARERYVLVKGTSRKADEELSEQETGICRYQSAGEIWRQVYAHQKVVWQDAEKKPDRVKVRQDAEKKTERVKARQDAEKRTKRTEVWQDAERAAARRSTRAKGELIAVYSPIHRIGKTAFAWNLGKKLAQKSPVLYLSLEEYAGNCFPPADRPEQNLADLLYYFRQGTKNLAIRMSAMAGQDDKLDYILPMPYVQDMQAVKGQEWIQLFTRILEDCIYEKVILDLGDSVDGMFDILESCAVVYTPYIEEPTAKEKLNQYFENLRKTGREGILEKTVQKKMIQEESGYKRGCRDK